MKSFANKKLVRRDVDRDDLKFWYDTNRTMYLGGRIDDEAYRVVSSLLMAGDSEGRLWTIGARSGKWYRREGKKWVEGTPEKNLTMLVPEAEITRIETAFRKMEARRQRRIEDWEKRGRPKPAGIVAGGIAAAEKGIGAGQVEQPEPAAKAPEIRHCMSCGTRLPEGSRFCLNCGEPIRPPKPDNPRCSACKTENEAGARFCSNCGAPLNR